MKKSGPGRIVARLAIVTICVVAVLPSPAAAAALGSRAVAIKPIYHERTKSYFELRVDLPAPYRWGTALKYARTKIFKGVRGRLAVVRDIDTHSFLKANFDIVEEAWIGLRYYCSFRKLLWADGTEQPRSKFKMWARKWHRTSIRCGTQNIQFMPIYYLPNAQGFNWQATGPAKQFVSYFVEYPTGSENPALEKRKKAEEKSPAEENSADSKEPAPKK